MIYHSTWNDIVSSVKNIKEAQGNAVAADVLSGKTFTNSTGNVISGTMVNRGGATTVTPTTSNQTKAAGYYSGAITIKGDSNLVAANIVSGKSIFGVAGSANNINLGTTPGNDALYYNFEHFAPSISTSAPKLYTIYQKIP